MVQPFGRSKPILLSPGKTGRVKLPPASGEVLLVIVVRAARLMLVAVTWVVADTTKSPAVARPSAKMMRPVTSDGTLISKSVMSVSRSIKLRLGELNGSPRDNEYSPDGASVISKEPS